MKLTDIQLRFIPNSRPGVTVKFDRTIEQGEADAVYEARFHKDSGAWLFKAEVGDAVFAGASMKGKGAARIRMADGVHSMTQELVRTNAPALNALWDEPCLDVMVHEGAGLTYGFINAIVLARYLFAYGRPVGLAVVEWPSGIRVFEPMQIAPDGEPVENRQCDKLLFLSRPGEFLDDLPKVLDN
jgi:hypothetical protein